MFDNLLRQFESLNGSTVSLTIPPDEDGSLDRACPNQHCQFLFKILQEDWKNLVRDEEVFCPFCPTSSMSDDWNTPQQLEYAKSVVAKQIRGKLGHAMQLDTETWNRRQSTRSFIQIKMKVGSRSPDILLPSAVVESMRLKIACPECSCRYAVIGVAFFCPACGHNAADQMFYQSLKGIYNTLDALSIIRSSISDRDIAEVTIRTIIENALEDAVTAFQRYAESLYEKFPHAQPAPQNAFQRLKDGSRLWQTLTGKCYDEYLDISELSLLSRYFQQRHLLAHRQGIVDPKYISNSGDSTYLPGQRIVIRDDDVRQCTALIEKLAKAMEHTSRIP